MKTLLVICGAGHATSTIAVSKINKWLAAEGLTNEVKIVQSKIADELNRIDQYDAVVSTTIVPDSIKDSQILLGALGKVYFVDWDHLRERSRNVNVIVMGEK